MSLLYSFLYGSLFHASMDSRDRGKRKIAEKDMPRRGHGRSTAAGNSGVAPRGRGDRGRRDQYIEDEERLEMLGHT
jgi:hypothetical protein